VFLPYFRAQKSGAIGNISSVAGFKGIAGVGLYISSKFAVEGVVNLFERVLIVSDRHIQLALGCTESLRLELQPFGIKVVSISPGDFRTEGLSVSHVYLVFPSLLD